MVFGTYDDAGEAIAASADTLILCMPPGCPEDEMVAMLEAIACGAGEHAVTQGKLLR